MRGERKRSASRRARDAPVNEIIGAEYIMPVEGAPPNVSESTALTVAAVYACVRLISETVAGLPLHIYRRDGNGKSVAADHPLDFLLHSEPNPEMTSFTFREAMMSHLLLWGNSYSQIVRNGAGKIVAMYPLLPDKIEVKRGADGEICYTYKSSTENMQTLRRSDVLHIPGLSFDGLVGYSPISMHRKSIGLALCTEDYGASFFENGAHPGGVLEHPSRVENWKAVADGFDARFSGAGAHKTAVLQEGMTYRPISINPQDAQFLETRKFQINEIARIFRVPPHMIGDLERATFSNIEHQSIDFARYTIKPWLDRLEQAKTMALIPPSEKKVFFVGYNMDGLLRGDYKSRMEGYAIGRQNGWMSPNDIRILEDMPLIPAEQGGDKYLVNGNMKQAIDEGDE